MQRIAEKLGAMLGLMLLWSLFFVFAAVGIAAAWAAGMYACTRWYSALPDDMDALAVGATVVVAGIFLLYSLSAWWDATRRLSQRFSSFNEEVQNAIKRTAVIIPCVAVSAAGAGVLAPRFSPEPRFLTSLLALGLIVGSIIGGMLATIILRAFVWVKTEDEEEKGAHRARR